MKKIKTQNINKNERFPSFVTTPCAQWKNTPPKSYFQRNFCWPHLFSSLFYVLPSFPHLSTEIASLRVPRTSARWMQWSLKSHSLPPWPTSILWHSSGCPAWNTSALGFRDHAISWFSCSPVSSFLPPQPSASGTSELILDLFLIHKNTSVDLILLSAGEEGLSTPLCKGCNSGLSFRDSMHLPAYHYPRSFMVSILGIVTYIYEIIEIPLYICLLNLYSFAFHIAVLNLSGF